MKKLLVLLVVLAMVAIASPLYSQSGDVSECEYCGGVHTWSGPHNVVIGGEFQYFKDTTNTFADFAKVELNINATIGDHNSVNLELDNAEAAAAAFSEAVLIDDLRLNTDIFGALMLDLPVTLNTTIGYFDDYFTGWKYVSYSGWDFYYGNWTISGNALGPDPIGAMRADIGVGPVTISYASDFEFAVLRFGASGGFGPVGFFASFGAPSSAFGDGALNVMVDYSGSFGDLSLYVPVHFGYDLGLTDLWLGGGVAVDYTSLVHLAVGFDYGQNAGADFTKLVVDLSSKPIGDLMIGVSAYMDFAATDVFSGLDAYVNYMFGASKFQIGYVYAPVGGSVPVMVDSANLRGLYFGLDVDL
jgi:hypothetical protein